jgi:DNA-directed RNA polymerase III subunit RPC3
MVLKVNYAQCALAFRTERLEEMADQYLGPVTASVYGALLRVLEAKLKARDDEIRDEDDDDEEERLPTATVVEVLEALDPTVDLRLGVLGASDVYKMANGNGKKPKEVILDDEWGDLGIKKEVYSDSEDDQPVNGFMSMRDRNKKMSLIEEHLKLLEEHAKMFCRRVGGGGRGEWRVNFPALTDALIHAEIDSNILDRFGKVHSRIVRLLRDRGRLEEKQVAALSIMRLKDVRAILTELQFVGLVEGQEVPKDNSRQPTRATYLWYQDPSRVASLLLQQTYQGMARILQRLKVERENYKNIIEKAEMLDVKQEALTQNEREAIMQWREVEERLAIQMNRMDDLVALLRDFSGRDSSLVS